MKSILITGGLGNLGSWLTEYFATRDWKVYVLTKSLRKVMINGQYEVLLADLTKAEEVVYVLKDLKIDIVIHAGSVNDVFVPDYATMAIDVNIKGTRILLDWAKGQQLQHFVYLSTFQVYGKYQGYIDELTPTLPINDYGTSHLAAELYVEQLGRTQGLPYTILRLTNSYGCPKDHDSSKWYLILNDLSRMAVKSKKIVLKSNGDAPRDFIWMGTVCEVLDNIVQKVPTKTTYNLCGSDTLSMKQVAEYVKWAYADYFHEEIPIELNTMDKTVYPEKLEVSNKKLQEWVEFEVERKFEAEAKKIFQLLTPGIATQK